MEALHNAEDVVMEAVSSAEDMVMDAVSSAETIVLEAVSSAETIVLEVVSNAKDEILDATGAKTIWPLAACLLALFSSILFIWRLWSFTLRPYFYPREPKRFPYWIPCHAVPFHDNSYGLITNGRSYFDETDEPIAFTVMGKTFYILTSPDHVTSAYENTTTLSWDASLKELLVSFGVERSTLGRMWNEPRKGDARYASFIDPKHKPLARLAGDLYREQFLPGPRMDIFNSKLLGLMDRSMHWEKIPSRYTANKEALSLMDFCANLMIDATTRSLFGDSIYEIEPSLNQMSIDFFDQAWKIVMFAYPRFAARKLYTSRQGIHNALLKYIQSPRKKRNDAAWLTTEMLKEQTAAGINDKDKASIMFLLFWVTNLNTYRLSFWILSYLLFDSNLLAAIRAETGPALRGGAVDHQHLFERCPRLMAVLNEALRLTFGSISVRKIVARTVIGNKTLRSGNTIMIPIRQLHYDEYAFGGDADEFDPNRFLNNNLDQSPSYRPFAGGITHCPGRFLAKREVLLFVALALHRFDIEVVGNANPDLNDEKGVSSPPVIDHVRPNLGIMAPVKGTEVYIKINESSRHI